MIKKVLTVQAIDLNIEKTNPPRLTINTKGEASSADWTNGHLIPFVYVVPPADGIYEFDFVAEAPSGKVPQLITTISAKPFVWEDFPIDLKGVKVYASSNSTTETIKIE